MLDWRDGLRSVMVMIVLCLLAGSASAQTATLAWDSSPDATGYRVRWGQSPGSYPNVADAGNMTSLELRGLVPGTTYWAVVDAYDGARQFSTPSDPLQFSLPAPPSTTPPDAPMPVPPGDPVHDMNQDGSPDIIWQNIKDGYIAAWPMAGKHMQDSVLTKPGRVADTNWRIVGSGNFNADTKPDLVWQHITEGWLAVWLMDGTTLLESASISPERVADTNWRIATIADLDGDGKSDLVWQEKSKGWVGVWLMNGTALKQSVSLSVERVPDTQWMIKGAGDMNGDGKQDLVWQHGTDGYLATWLMDGFTVLDSALLSPTRVSDNDWSIVGVADANGDRKADLYWRDNRNGHLGLWLMDGLNLSSSVALQPERVADPNWRIVAVR